MHSDGVYVVGVAGHCAELADCAICMFVRASQSESVHVNIKENLEDAVSILAADATCL